MYGLYTTQPLDFETNQRCITHTLRIMLRLRLTQLKAHKTCDY
nr:MAG TPA_asm: hypothetical protein [Caudoviricetes sp.]